MIKKIKYKQTYFSEYAWPKYNGLIIFDVVCQQEFTTNKKILQAYLKYTWQGESDNGQVFSVLTFETDLHIYTNGEITELELLGIHRHSLQSLQDKLNSYEEKYQNPKTNLLIQDSLIGDLKKIPHWFSMKVKKYIFDRSESRLLFGRRILKFLFP